MTESEILYQIRRCEEQADDCLHQRLRLERQYDELSELHDRFSRLQSDFISRQQSQLNLLRHRVQAASGLRSARSYLEGMHQLIGGSDFQRASNGLGTARERILQERYKIRQMMDEIEYQRKKALNDLQYWREQLYIVRQEAQEAEGE